MAGVGLAVWSFAIAQDKLGVGERLPGGEGVTWRAKEEIYSESCKKPLIKNSRLSDFIFNIDAIPVD